MMIRTARTLLVAFSLVATAASAQQASVADADNVQQGHRLANLICSNCHIAAPDQPFAPILRPPAPSFESIAQRRTTSAVFIRSFLATTHRDISNPEGMPNPQLLDFQIEQVTAYFMSLRRPAAAPASR
jgi:mono/diheme cytochrome c family protein